MSVDAPVFVGPDAVRHLVDFCQRLATRPFTLVSDIRTYRALGEQIEAALKQARLPVINIVLEGAEVIADEKYLLEVLVRTPPGDQVFVAIGSGTVTDLARYVSFRTRNSFISAPTAASVDGFLSTVAPLVINGVKDTYPAQGPLAVFADLPTLAAAPPELRAAGFGDVIGKTTALADWRLGHLLWDEPFSRDVEQRVRSAMADCFENADEIARGSEQGVHSLIEALLETGRCMLVAGDSRPASGSEHHCSHYWEMQLLKENKPAILHGSKVGYAAILIAQLYDRLRTLTQDDVRRRVEDMPYPEPDAAIGEMRHAYGAGADAIQRIQAPFLALTETEFRDLQRRIVEHWPTIRAIAETVLPAATISELLETVGAPTHWKSLGLEEQLIEPALLYGHYLRNRFTVIKLCKLLGIDVRPAAQQAR